MTRVHTAPDERGAFRDRAAPALGSTTITRRWFRPIAYFLLLCFMAWSGVLTFWYTMALDTGATGTLGALVFAVPLAHVGVALGLGYVTAALFVNHTRIELEDEAITVRHEPLPWRGNVTLQAIGVERTFIRIDHPHSPWTVLIGTASHPAIELVRVPDAAQATFLAEAIAEHFGVTMSRDMA